MCGTIIIMAYIGNVKCEKCECTESLSVNRLDMCVRRTESHMMNYSIIIWKVCFNVLLESRVEWRLVERNAACAHENYARNTEHGWCRRRRHRHRQRRRRRLQRQVHTSCLHINACWRCIRNIWHHISCGTMTFPFAKWRVHSYGNDEFWWESASMEVQQTTAAEHCRLLWEKYIFQDENPPEGAANVHPHFAYVRTMRRWEQRRLLQSTLHSKYVRNPCSSVWYSCSRVCASLSTNIYVCVFIYSSGLSTTSAVEHTIFTYSRTCNIFSVRMSCTMKFR